jgi:hypothetical protein
MTMPIDIFISYAQQDKALRLELEKHLAGLKKKWDIRIWGDEQILPGKDLYVGLYQQIDTARIILLLVSSDFLSSSYCCDVQMTRVLERWQREKIHVVPVILRDCSWKGAMGVFDRMKMLPEKGRPITHWQQQDQAWAIVAQGIDQIVEQMQVGASPVGAPLPHRSFISQTGIDAGIVGHPPAPSRPAASAGRASAHSSRVAVEEIGTNSAPSKAGIWLLVGAGAASLLLLIGAVITIIALRGGGGEPSSSNPPSGQKPISLPIQPPQPVQQVAACSAPCCGGTACSPGDQNTADSICATAPDYCALCRSGRSCVAGACSTALAPKRGFQVRLARVDMAGLDPGALVCVKRAGAPAWEARCTAVADAADLPGVMVANGMRNRLLITTADLLGGRGLDIELRSGSDTISQPGAVLSGRTVKSSALCVGIFFNVGRAHIAFYLDD